MGVTLSESLMCMTSNEGTLHNVIMQDWDTMWFYEFLIMPLKTEIRIASNRWSHVSCSES